MYYILLVIDEASLSHYYPYSDIMLYCLKLIFYKNKYDGSFKNKKHHKKYSSPFNNNIEIS